MSFAGQFLSCLRGSEQKPVPVGSGWIFLSCLRGSELIPPSSPTLHAFLSCLRGSELDFLPVLTSVMFLSACAAVNIERIVRLPRLISELPARHDKDTPTETFSPISELPAAVNGPSAGGAGKPNF